MLCICVLRKLLLVKIKNHVGGESLICFTLFFDMKMTNRLEEIHSQMSKTDAEQREAHREQVGEKKNECVKFSISLQTKTSNIVAIMSVSSAGRSSLQIPLIEFQESRHLDT